MLLRRCAYVAFCLVLILYLIRDPAGAAHTALVIAHLLALAADGLARFASALL